VTEELLAPLKFIPGTITLPSSYGTETLGKLLRCRILPVIRIRRVGER
jgi:hypothetical protein